MVNQFVRLASGD